MKPNSIITIKAWLFKKLEVEMKPYHMNIVRQYYVENGAWVAAEGALKVEEVLAETEKAVKVAIEAEGERFVTTWTAWLPKSCILEA